MEQVLGCCHEEGQSCHVYLCNRFCACMCVCVCVLNINMYLLWCLCVQDMLKFGVCEFIKI